MHFLFLLTWQLLTASSPPAPCALLPAPFKSAEVYVASTPCDGPVRAYLSIPAGAESEFITWRLILRPDTRQYDMRYTYGMTVPGTRGFRNGGTTVSHTGAFTIVPGKRPVISLTVGQKQLPFARIGDGLLHLLDTEGHLMIGNGAWSYTFNQQKP